VARLTGPPIARTRAPVIRLEAVDSTQNYAARLALQGAVDGTVVMAQTQTAGRGRKGRIWRDVPGESLLLSVIRRPAVPGPRLPLLSLAAAVGVAEALRDPAGVDARLKWPNDVHVNGRKIAGILLECRGDVVLLGIGVNVAQHEFDADLAATSIAIEGGHTDRDALLAAMCAAIARWCEHVERGAFGAVRARWTALATTPGRRVTVDGITGTALGLDDDGALLVDHAGTTVRVLAGDVAEVP
jgi:BirA family transcriptional regulator, biotin operon repressor / biotin---[acetyl-CoA-carboxylase] ligase